MAVGFILLHLDDLKICLCLLLIDFLINIMAYFKSQNHTTKKINTEFQ